MRAQVKLDGQLVEHENSMESTFAGSPIKLGRTVAIQTEAYDARGAAGERDVLCDEVADGTVSVVRLGRPVNASGLCFGSPAVLDD